MDLGRLITPDDPAFRDLARQTFDERADLQQAYPSAEDDGFLRWVAVNGLLEYPDRFARYFPSIPAEEHRVTGCGGGDVQKHLWGGLEDLETVLETYEVFSGRPATALGSVLDFGSGCGRVIRWLDRLLPSARLCGIDVREPSIEWSRAHLRGEFHLGGFDPPTALPDRQFDLVYALSLFSHFTLAANRAWFRELVRLCKPDGMLVVSTHGPFSLAAIARLPDLQESFGMSPERAHQLLRDLRRDRFHFYAMPPDLRQRISVGENYGQAFLTEGFVDREWASCAEVLGCVPARLFHFQDVYALRPISAG